MEVGQASWVVGALKRRPDQKGGGSEEEAEGGVRSSPTWKEGGSVVRPSYIKTAPASKTAAFPVKRHTSPSISRYNVGE
jgi:hypothetical protein